MKLVYAFFVFMFLFYAESFAGSPTYHCPACAGVIQCKRTMPNEITGSHPLEQERQSIWHCRSCGLRFLLRTPVGKLSKIAKRERHV